MPSGVKDLLTREEKRELLKLTGQSEAKTHGQSPELPPFPGTDLPSPYRALLDVISPTTEASPEALFLGIACALGAALGRKVALPLTLPLYPMLWALVIAPPYFYRKGSVLHWGGKIAEKLTPGLIIPAGLGSAEAIHELLADGERIKLFYRLAELGSTLAKAGRSGTRNIPYELCDLFDHIDGWSPGTKGKKPCSGYEVTILTASTLRGIEPLIREAHISGGFLRRFALVQASETDPVPNPLPVDEEQLQKILDPVKQQLSHYGPGTKFISLDQKAKLYYGNWYCTWREACLKLPEGEIEIVGSTETTARKLALQRAALDKKRTISVEIIEWAIRLAEYYQAQALHVVGALALSPWRRWEQRIVEILKQQPRRAREIQQRLSNPPAATTLRQILEGMASMGMIERYTVPGNKKGSGEWWRMPASEDPAGDRSESP